MIEQINARLLSLDEWEKNYLLFLLEKEYVVEEDDIEAKKIARLAIKLGVPIHHIADEKWIMKD